MAFLYTLVILELLFCSLLTAVYKAPLYSRSIDSYLILKYYRYALLVLYGDEKRYGTSFFQKKKKRYGVMRDPPRGVNNRQIGDLYHIEL